MRTGEAGARPWHQGPFVKKRIQAVPLIVTSVFFLLTGCATVETPISNSHRFTDLLTQYPHTDQPLQVRKLTSTAFSAVSPATPSPDVFILVHPAYSLFFREANRSQYPEGKYSLLLHQFNSEAYFIREAARSGYILILIIPGNYATESIAPLSYTSYLNAIASAGPSVFYLVSESADKGTISTNDLVDLYHFLNGIKALKVLVGGGFIGRCQEQFYDQAAAYLNDMKTYIVPEISTISPDDVSEAEAGKILESIKRRDYTGVRKLISQKQGEKTNFFSIPPRKEM
jgi:hypothetical protein